MSWRDLVAEQEKTLDRVRNETGVEIAQYGDITNNFGCGCGSRGGSSYTPPIDASNFSQEEILAIGGSTVSSYLGKHEINGITYDFKEGGDESAMYEGYDITDFDTELQAEYGTFDNWVMGQSIEAVVAKDKNSFMTKIFGLSNSTKRGLEVANKAREKLRQVDEDNRLSMTERFKNKSEEEMREEIKGIKHQSKVKHMADALREMSQKERELNKINKAKEMLLKEIDKEVKHGKEELAQMMDKYSRLKKPKVAELGKPIEAEVIYANEIPSYANKLR